MKKNAQVTVSAQRHFTMDNWSFQHLRVSPTLHFRDGDNEPFTYREVSEFSTAGGRYSTDVRTNEHGQRYSYANASHELIFRSTSTEYRFNATKFGNQVIYSTNSPGASVAAYYWIYDDVLASLGLVMNRLDTPTAPGTVEADRGFEVQINDQVTPYAPGDPLYPAPEEKVLQILIADTDKFSFLSNFNLYFSGCDVYQDFPPGKMHKVDRHGEGRPRVASEHYLTADKSYPEGVTTLTIKDGFSDATAVVEFDHDTSKKQVTVTIKSFTSRTCDFRHFLHDDHHYPNTICFIL